MIAGDVVLALGLPEGARVDQRVPKKLLTEHGAPTAADKRRIAEGVDELFWLATLKPTTIGVPTFRDEEREYLEIAVVGVELRAAAKGSRLAELIHRAIPYPMMLIASQGASATMSMAHKRRSQGEAKATVLDGDVVTVAVGKSESDHDVEGAFRDALALARQPHGDLLALYQGWMDTLVALLAGRVSGSFHLPDSAEDARRRRDALRHCETLDIEIARLRQAASRERQVARQVELNLELKRVEQQHSTATQDL